MNKISDNNEKTKENEKHPTLNSFIHSRAAFHTCVMTVVFVLLGPCIFIYLLETDLKIAEIIRDHLVAFIGVPWAGGTACVIVLMFRHFSGEFHFKALGLELKGAAAPALFWVVCFLSIILAIKLLW